MTPQTLFDRVVAVAPDFHAVLSEHRTDNDGVLPHVLMGDLLRYVGAKLDRAQPSELEEVKAITTVLESGIRSGNPATENVIAVSFLEHIDAEPFYERLRPFLGPQLVAEHVHQVSWRPHDR